MATRPSLEEIYRQYIDAINRYDLSALGEFVDADVVHNARTFGLEPYKNLIMTGVVESRIQVRIVYLTSNEDHIACQLEFFSQPATTKILGFDVSGKNVTFTENVLYKFEEGKIREVWSVVDIEAIRQQTA